MTNEELKVKIDEFLSKNKFSNIILSNLDLMIKICELYSELNEDLVDVKFSNVNLETYPKLDLFTKIVYNGIGSLRERACSSVG